MLSMMNLFLYKNYLVYHHIYKIKNDLLNYNINYPIYLNNDFHNKFLDQECLVPDNYMYPYLWIHKSNIHRFEYINILINFILYKNSYIFLTISKYIHHPKDSSHQYNILNSLFLPLRNYVNPYLSQQQMPMNQFQYNHYLENHLKRKNFHIHLINNIKSQYYLDSNFNHNFLNQEFLILNINM